MAMAVPYPEMSPAGIGCRFVNAHVDSSADRPGGPGDAPTIRPAAEDPIGGRSVAESRVKPQTFSISGLDQGELVHEIIGRRITYPANPA